MKRWKRWAQQYRFWAWSCKPWHDDTPQAFAFAALVLVSLAGAAHLTGCAWFRANPEVVEAGADAIGERADVVCAAVPNARDRAACVLAVRVASALAADAARIAAEAAVEGQACPVPSAKP